MRISAKVKKALHKHCDHLMEKGNVVGVMTGEQTKGGHGTGKEAVIVLVKKKMQKDLIKEQDLIPASVDDVQTDVIEVGEIKAQFRNSHRPLVPGTSVGHKNVTAGTIGLFVRKNGEVHILSNNHVLANSNSAQIGDEILQPGKADGGRLDRDMVANLSEFIRIDFSSTNYVDAALAKVKIENAPPPVEQPPAPPPPKKENNLLKRLGKFLKRLLSLHWLKAIFGSDSDEPVVTNPTVNPVVPKAVTVGDNQPLGMSTPITKKLESAEVGEEVQKSGRTTGYTQGKILGTNAVVNVNYGTAGTARFSNQILTSNMSAGGDSGSAVFDMEGNLIGLLYAGSETVTILNHADDVFEALGIDEIL